MTEENDLLSDYNWGGDGKDLDEPVRAHVLAALVPTDQPYPSPVDELLKLGHPHEHADADERIAALELRQEHVADLVRMARDRALNTSRGDNDSVWGPLYALRALKRLDIASVVDRVIPLLDVDDEWYGEELPEILGHAGMAALEPLRQHLLDHTRWRDSRSRAGSALAEVAKQHPELRERAIEIFGEALARGKRNDPTFNGFLIGDLLDFDAVEALPMIRRLFEQDAVDESIAGDWGEVLRALGQEPDPSDALVRRSSRRWDSKRARGKSIVLPQLEKRLPQPSATRQASSSAKRKRKQAAASRKVNKKKRK
jgi:hypothetical protein